MKIKLIPITTQQKLYEAFGFTGEQAIALKKEITDAWIEAVTWSQLLKIVMKEQDDDLTTALKLLTVGELMGVMK